MTSAHQPRIAIVHEWLLDYAGSERVLQEILALYPQADLFALIDLPDDELKAAIPRRAKATTSLQFLPSARRWLQYYVPLMPFAIRQLDVGAYDIIVSSSHAVAKGVRTRPHQLHVSYVHTPMRYAWDLQDEYLRAAGLARGILGWLARYTLSQLRQWDVRSAEGVNVLVANSTHVARRIKRAYGRDAQVLNPPIDVGSFPINEQREDYYLTVSRLEAYKRVDLLVEAFAAMPERRLVIIGAGPEMRRLSALAPPNVTLCGRLATADVRDHMRRAKAFLFAGIEDFGIVMAEAQACGAPVIAFGNGGALDIVCDESSPHPTGLFFGEQTSTSVAQAVHRFERQAFRFLPSACRSNSLRFDRGRFREQFAEIVQRHWSSMPENPRQPRDGCS